MGSRAARRRRDRRARRAAAARPHRRAAPRQPSELREGAGAALGAGPPLIEKLCELPMASMREPLLPALMAVHNCTHVRAQDARLRLLLGDGAGDAAEAAATTWEGGNRRQFWWLIGSPALRAPTATTRRRWRSGCRSSRARSSSRAPALLVAPRARSAPAARLEVHRVARTCPTTRRGARREQVCRGPGEKLGVPVVEALVPPPRLRRGSGVDARRAPPRRRRAAPSRLPAEDGGGPQGGRRPSPRRRRRRRRRGPGRRRGAARIDRRAARRAPPADRMAVWRPPRHSQVGVSASPRAVRSIR